LEYTEADSLNAIAINNRKYDIANSKELPCFFSCYP